MEAPNFAKNKEFAEHTMNTLLACFEDLRTSRRTLESRWNEYYELWAVNPDAEDQGRNYSGRANLNIPQTRKEVETMSRRIMKGLFPEDYLKAVAARIENEDVSITNTQVVRHYYDNIIGIKPSLAPWVKQGVLYGTSPGRQYWKKETNYQYFKKREFKESPEGVLIPTRKDVFEEVILYDAPVIETCDLFQTYVFPQTAQRPRDIQIVFFQTKINKESLDKKKAEGCYVIPKEIEEAEGSDALIEFEETQVRLATFGASSSAEGPPGSKYYDILEAWCKLPVKITIKGKLQEVMLPCVVEILNKKHCIRIQQNPNWHQQPPFFWMRYVIPLPGRFYGHGLPESVISLQNQLNDTLNQTMDGTTLALNPITIVNPAFAPNAESFEVEPGAIWWADPSGVKSFTFPDLSDVGLKNASLLRGMITEMSDNSPQLPDPIAGKARSTGQAQLAINEWQTDLFNFIETIVTDALQPLAAQTHALLQQNLPDDAIFRISGKYAGNWVNKVVTPQDVVGSYDWKWIGNYGIDNIQVKTQQMLTLLKILPALPPNSGITINWPNFMIKLMRDGFQIKDVENIISTEFLNSSLDPSTENKLLEIGGTVQVHPSDDGLLHNRWHQVLLAKTKDPYIRSLVAEHMKKHSEATEKKQAAMMQQQQMMQMMAMQQAQGGGGGGSPKGPMGNRNNPMGNQTQISESTNPSDLEKGLR